MNKGFITIPALIIAVLGLIVVGGGGYTAVKFNALQKANTELAEKVNSMNEPKEEVVVEQIPQEEVIATSSEQDIEVVATTSDEQKNDKKEEPKVIVEQKIVYVPVKTETPTPVVPKPVEVVPEVKEEVAEVAETPEYLKIYDIEKKVNGFVVEVFWKTNKKSDSRLILGASEFDLGVSKIHVSDNQDSTNHYVKLNNLEWSSVYSYQLIAEADGETDTFYDKLATERKFKVQFSNAEEYGNHCIGVRVVDTKNIPLEDTAIRISGAWFPPSGSPRYLSDTVEKETDNDGVVIYCDNIDEINVENVKTKDVYYKGKVVI